MVTPNVTPLITDGDIEAQREDDFTHEATRLRMDPTGALRWAFDKVISHLRCRQKA